MMIYHPRCCQRMLTSRPKKNNIPLVCGKYSKEPDATCLNASSREAPKDTPTVPWLIMRASLKMHKHSWKQAPSQSRCHMNMSAQVWTNVCLSIIDMILIGKWQFCFLAMLGLNAAESWWKGFQSELSRYQLNPANANSFYITVWNRIRVPSIPSLIVCFSSRSSNSSIHLHELHRQVARAKVSICSDTETITYLAQDLAKLMFLFTVRWDMDKLVFASVSECNTML